MDYKKAVVILSGGMDSTTLLYKMLKEYKSVHAISFDYGQRHNTEIQFAMETCHVLRIPHKIVTFAFLQQFKGSALTDDSMTIPEGHYEDENMKLTVVPNRNSIMLNIALAYAISKDFGVVGYGAHAGDHAIYPDCRPQFVEVISHLAKLIHFEPLKIYAPFIRMTKADIVKLGTELGVDYSLTWSCYKGGDVHCGKCGTCVERIEAFKIAGVYDPMTGGEKCQEQK